MTLWWLIPGMAALTYAVRSLPILLFRQAPHPLVERALHHATVAAFAALIVPALLAPLVPPGLPEGGPRLWAGLAGVLVAWRTRNMLLTLLGGLGAFALLRWLLG